MSAQAPPDLDVPAVDGEPVPGWAVRLLVDVAVIRTGMTAVADHETRIRSIERRAYVLAGAAAVAGAGAGRLLDMLTTTT